MKIINKIKKLFKTVYCEDCKYCKISKYVFQTKLICEKHPFSISNCEKRDYVTIKKQKTIDGFKYCKKVRKKLFFCFQFSPKNY